MHDQSGENGRNADSEPDDRYLRTAHQHFDRIEKDDELRDAERGAGRQRNTAGEAGNHQSNEQYDDIEGCQLKSPVSLQAQERTYGGSQDGGPIENGPDALVDDLGVEIDEDREGDI